MIRLSCGDRPGPGFDTRLTGLGDTCYMNNLLTWQSTNLSQSAFHYKRRSYEVMQSHFQKELNSLS